MLTVVYTLNAAWASGRVSWAPCYNNFQTYLYHLLELQQTDHVHYEHVYFADAGRRQTEDIKTTEKHAR